MATPANQLPHAGGAATGGGGWWGRLWAGIHHLRLVFQFKSRQGPSGPAGLSVRLKDGTVAHLLYPPRIGGRIWTVEKPSGNKEVTSSEVLEVFNTAEEAGYGMK